MSTPVLEAVELKVQRGNEMVLNGVSFQVDAGEVFALLGGNGAGKSNTLLTFLGLLLPHSGKARILDEAVQENLAEVRSKVAYLPEAVSLYGHLSARENLNYFLALAGLKRSPADIDAALDQVLLQADARHLRMERFSKGMRQKTAIALALLRQAPILLLDEPTSGLDPVAIDEFNKLISDLAISGSTVLMVTHDVYGACQVANRIALLREGGIVGAFEATEGARIETEAVHAAFSQRHAA